MSSPALLRRFSVRAPLLGCTAAVVATLASVAAAGHWALADTAGQTRELLAGQTTASAVTDELRRAVDAVRGFEHQVLLTGTNAVESDRWRQAWRDEVRKADGLIAAAAATHPAAAEALGKGREGLKAYAEAIGPVLDQVVAVTMDAQVAAAYGEKAGPSHQAARDAAKALAEAVATEAVAARDRAESRARTAMAVVSGVALLLGAGIAAVLLVTLRSICGPLDAATRVARDIADGHLDGRVPHDGANDEPGRLMDALQAMHGRLRDLVGALQSGSEQIHVASREIAGGNADLSSRTEQTAGNLQHAASAMEHLSGTVRQTAESARTANQLASSAAEVASRGGQVVEQVVATMGEISQASRKIADIIGTIDGIAFQTNILALNAAVEAARAGEQGRGFAVVASEVRSLASRSAEAAKQIKGLIGASVDKVESGASLVTDAGRTMDEIVASVQRVVDTIAEISAATADQSEGIGQVAASVGELDRMTQQNAALVEQSAAAAESLQDQAQRLGSLIARFSMHRPGEARAPMTT